MVEIRRVGVLSLALMTGLLYTALGLIVGLFSACASILGMAGFTAILEDVTDLSGLGGGEIVFGLVLVICFPFVYGIIGFIAGAILGVLYNIIAGMVGGIQVELTSKS